MKQVKWTRKIIAGGEMFTDGRETWFAAPIDSSAKPARWVSWFRIVDQDGQPVIAEVRIFPAAGQRTALPPGTWTAKDRERFTPQGGITAKVLRQILLPFTGAFYAHFVGPEGEEVRDFPRFKHDDGAAKGRVRSREFYLGIAVEYAETIKTDRSPVATMANRRRLARAVVRDAISRARQLGFLTSGPKGRPGGSLTDAARQLLQEMTTKKGKG